MVAVDIGLVFFGEKINWPGDSVGFFDLADGWLAGSNTLVEFDSVVLVKSGV